MRRFPIRSPRCKGRPVQAAFAGGDITSNGGALLLREADRRLGLTGQAAAALTDPRRRLVLDFDATESSNPCAATTAPNQT